MEGGTPFELTQPLNYKVEVFEHLNGEYAAGQEVHNNTAELEKHLAEKKKAREILR